jgi:hypothetical protein
VNRDRLSGVAVLVLALAIGLAAGCADPARPVRDNPLDSVGTNYHNPGVELLAGPPEGTVVRQGDVTFRWRGTGKANRFKHQLDNAGWSDWSAADSARFDFLDDGNHLFAIYAKTDCVVQGTPLQSRFTVDAVDSPAMLTVPWHAQAKQSDTIYIQVMKQGGGPIAQARLMLSYHTAVLGYCATYAGNGWYQSGDTASIVDSSSPGMVDVIIRLSPPGSGMAGDAIALVKFVALGPVAADPLAITPAAFLRSVSGDTLVLTSRRGSIITISQ